MSTFTTRANFSIFSFWAANSVFSICTTLSFCCARSAKVRLDSTACSAYQAEQAVLSKRTLALRAQQNDKVVQMLKTELAAQKEKMLKLARVVKVLIQELIKAAPERAHAL